MAKITAANLAQQYLNQSAQAQKDAIAAAEATQKFNSAEALKEREWSERMSNTAHQREIADLQAAGLNPVLSAYSGGASAYTGASASTDNALASLLGNIASSALQTAGSLASTIENNTTAIKTANIGAKATTKAAKTTAKATTKAANTNANAAVTNAKIQAKTQRDTTAQTNAYNYKIAQLNAKTSTLNTQIAGKFGLKQAKVNQFTEKYKADLAFLSAYADRENQKYIEKMKTLTNAAVSIFNTTTTNATNIVTSMIGIIDFF